MSLAIYIVDDEKHAIELLTDFVNRTPGLILSGSSLSPLNALKEIAAHPPAITLLDIDMPELNGLDVAGMINGMTRVIFTTSYREYAPEAFEKDASGYLLKPIPYDRFLTVIQKIRLSLNIESTNKSEPSFFFVKSGTKSHMIRIDIAAIQYIIAAANYIELHMGETKILTYLTMNEIFSKLPEAGFSRIHKSYIVNHNFIEFIEYAQVRLKSLLVLPIGRAYRQAFMQKMDGFFLFSNRDH